MAKDLMKKFYTFDKMTKNLLFMIGFYPPKGASNLYRIIPYCNMLMHAYAVFGVLRFMQIHINNILAVVSVLGVLISHLVSIIKVIMICTYMI